MGNIISIREFISEMYPDAETIPQELLESCEVLFEATKREVQLKVYFQQAFDALRKKKWTVDKIDKEIKKIEKCNNAIDRYREDNRKSPEVLKTATYWEDQAKHFFYGCALSFISAAAIGGYMMLMTNSMRSAAIAGAVGGSIIGSEHMGKRDREYNVDGSYKKSWYAALYRENEKAIKWLKEERERILNGTAKKKKLSDIITGKQESANIFSDIVII